MNSKAAHDLDGQFRNVSKLYEKQFLREMVKAMRSTVHEGGFIQSNQAEKIFREQLDEQYVEQWGDQGGIGLSDLIYQQLNEKFGQRLMQQQGLPKPRGPLPAEQEPAFGVKSKINGEKIQNQIQRREDIQPGSPGDKDVTLLMPWDGKIVRSFEAPLGGTAATPQKVLEVSHDIGLNSQFIVPQLGHSFHAGERVLAGQPLGQIQNLDLGFFWSIGKS